MADTYIEKQLAEQFMNRENFTREELLAFYEQYEPGINEGTFGWKIYALKKKHIIESVKKGVYTLVVRKNFRPELEAAVLNIGNILNESFNHYFYNIWNTAWLNEFTELQTTSSLIILEIDKSSMESVFYLLRDKQINVYLKPDENTIERYISEDIEAIIIKPMVTRAPTIAVKKITVPTLEKILVDLFCDEKIFYAYQGYQLKRIYEACFEKYIINISRMLNYAKRRKREEALKGFLLESIPNKLKNLIE